MCYLTIKGILGSCESFCLLPEFFCFWEKVKFFIFFIGWFLLLWDRCGSLWVVVDRCGSFRVLVTTSGGCRKQDN